ncbi:hypothetical protein MXB_4313 [Myxobolus squamalis]|nr:hypothetical protein MXB_4313 [Myxobolus squamalis]
MYAQDSKYKIVVLGEVSGNNNFYKLVVGKTSLITRYIFGNFYNSYNPTVGIDFTTKLVYVDHKRVASIFVM